MRIVLTIGATLIPTAPSGAQCVGDCDNSGTINVGELVTGVNIALDLRELADCPSYDNNGNGRVDINELLAAVRSALDGCPTPATTPTPTATSTATPSPTLNAPPVVDLLPIYRTFPDLDVRLPLPVTDPEGGELTCEMSNLPDGAMYDPQTMSMLWTPTDEQLGPFYSEFSCTDAATPPLSADGDLIFKVSPVDTCTVSTCAPATGCDTELLTTDANCCTGEPDQRVAEPDADCPQGRALFIGRNERDGFGRLHNCDLLRLSVLAQSGARLLFNVETRCLSTRAPMSLAARLETKSRGDVFNVTTAPIFFFRPRSDGYDERLGIQIPIDNPPYFDLEDAEANFHVTMTDADGVSASHTVRVVLTSSDVPDLPEGEPEP